MERAVRCRKDGVSVCLRGGRWDGWLPHSKREARTTTPRVRASLTESPSHAALLRTEVFAENAEKSLKRSRR